MSIIQFMHFISVHFWTSCNGDCKKKKKKKKRCKAYSFQDMLGISVRNTSHVKPIIPMFVFELLDVEQYFSISVHF